jgi:voltage-gated potassium channel
MTKGTMQSRTQEKTTTLASHVIARARSFTALLQNPGPFRNILTGMTFFIITVVIAICGYILSGWSLLDATYMVVITVFGVGFGEVKPLTEPGIRVFTMFVIIAGSISVVSMVGGFVQLLTEGEIRRALEAKRMNRTIQALKEHVIICGYGRMGQILAQQMKESDLPFILIDTNQERLADAESLGYVVFNGNATDENILLQVGIEHASILATVLPDDAANVFITLTARGLNPDLIILARGEFPSTEKKLRLAGAQHVVLPATIGALKMTNIIKHPAAMNYLDSNEGGNALQELLTHFELMMNELTIEPNSVLCGKTMDEVEIQGEHTFILVALRRADGSTITHPDKNLLVEANDTLIVMGHRGDIPKINQSARKQPMQYRGAKFSR